ncbi:peroxisomal biogenesis factor 19 [Leptidea sinapis]|uniref:peroxisomal biogenesis factor 19 n=1 Tax=Leptidea sinapis TaxID=189913 RepID=UPI00212CB8BD|nr:peroxisomal biogenesis factor 19 [Leptidea sinapis]
MSENKEETSKEIDPELDELLDSALQDMLKSRKQEKPEPAENMWSEEFIKEAAAQFESNMAAIMGGFSGMPEDQITQEQIAQTFTKMAEAAAHVLQPQSENLEVAQNNETDPVARNKIDEVSAAISQTLQSLNSNTEALKTPFSEQDLAGMFSNFNMADADSGQDGNMFVPFMQGMMQSLLSKEVLYPSLKDLVEKYPAWLASNKGKVEPADYERYEKQFELMTKVCSELEPEQESDSDDVKRRRFQVVLDLMQKMQDLGQPPTELVGDISAPPEGFVAPPGQDASSCSLM